MWTRSDFKCLSNPDDIKYVINLYPDDEPSVAEMVLRYSHAFHPCISISIEFNHGNALENTHASLATEFQLPIKKVRTTLEVPFNLNESDVCFHAKSLFELLTKTLQSLPVDMCCHAFSDIRFKVFPIENRIPWGQPCHLFQASIAKLNNQLDQQLAHESEEENSTDLRQDNNILLAS